MHHIFNSLLGVWISQRHTVSRVWCITCQINLKMSQNLKQGFGIFLNLTVMILKLATLQLIFILRKDNKIFKYTWLCTWVNIYLLLFSPFRWRRSFLFSLIFGVPTFVIFITYVILDELERRPNQLILPGLSLENLLMFILCTPVQVSIDYTWNQSNWLLLLLAAFNYYKEKSPSDQVTRVWGGGSHVKRRGGGGACWKFWKEPLRYQILFCGYGLKYFSPLRGTNSNTTLFPAIFFQLNTLKGTSKAPAVDYAPGAYPGFCSIQHLGIFVWLAIKLLLT